MSSQVKWIVAATLIMQTMSLIMQTFDSAIKNAFFNRQIFENMTSFEEIEHASNTIN